MRTILLSLVLVACGGADTTTTTTTPTEPAAGYTHDPTITDQQATAVEPAVTCPIEVDGATVVAEPLDDGIALVFITDAEHVGEVRARAKAFAGTGELDHTARIGSIDAVATVIDTVDGARLELRPVDPGQLGELRRQARARVVAMETGACEPARG